MGGTLGTWLDAGQGGQAGQCRQDRAVRTVWSVLTGQDSAGRCGQSRQDRTGQDRRGKDRTGQDGEVSAGRTGQDRVGQCGKATTRGQHVRTAVPPVGGASPRSTRTRPLFCPAHYLAPAPPLTLEPGARWRPRSSPAGSAAQVRPVPAPTAPCGRLGLSPSPHRLSVPLLTARVFHMCPCRGLGFPHVPPCPCRAVLGSAPHTCGGCALPVLTCLCPPGVLPLCCRSPAWDRAARPPPSPLQPPGLPCRSFSNNKIQVELDGSSGTAGCTSAVSPSAHGPCGAQAGSLPPLSRGMGGSGHGKSPKPQMLQLQLLRSEVFGDGSLTSCVHFRWLVPQANPGCHCPLPVPCHLCGGPYLGHLVQWQCSIREEL